MTKRYIQSTCLLLITLFYVLFACQPLSAQNAGENVTGVVTESGSGLPLKQVTIQVASTGTTADTDDNGAFTISVPDLTAELLIKLPGYIQRSIFLNGRNVLSISMVADGQKSFDNGYNTPNGSFTQKDAVYAMTAISANEFNYSRTTSFDQVLQGKVPGMSTIQQSGMPGSRTYMNLRGFTSLYAKSEPVLVIDGMIHDYAYANQSLMEGFALNPMDVVDVDDIADISVLKEGNSLLGAIGSNGVININTEQKSEIGTVMKFNAYGGITTTPANQEVLNGSQFKNYFSEMLHTQGYEDGEINSMYPWLNGGTTADEYYRYNNNTDWQNEIYSPAVLSKFHFFLKGGDDIATYNISTGYLTQDGILDNSSYTRYNLRINGKINITDKFTIIPNAKLSLADSKISNQGPSEWKNAILASLLKPSIMAPYAKDAATGVDLDYLDDVGDIFPVSNPVAITTNATGSNRNYHFLSSVTAQYRFNEHFTIATMLGLNFNNARENIFLPDLGIVQVDSAYNSPGDFVSEFRSTQNHTTFTYTNNTVTGHSILFNAGFRYMNNTYKTNLSLDLNTPSDDFKSLGQGSQYSFLRSTTGDNRELNWISYYGNLNYSFRNKYFVNANVSYDGNSATNEANRYNFYPSVGAAWRLSSENFMSDAKWIDDLKIRGSFSNSGNMFSTIYDYSKLYYTDRRINNTGVLVREVIPNEDLELEKKTTVNGGIDMSFARQQLNLHFDFYKSNINNLVIRQELPASYGYTNYFDNGGKLESTGFEFSADTRFQFGDLIWTLGGSISKIMTEIKELNFINTDNEAIITNIQGGQYITSVGNAINNYWGYKTNGLVSASEAGKVTGPNGLPMQEGDVKFVDNGDNIINDEDKAIIGNPNPDFFGGVYTTFAYKRFGVTAVLNYSVGNDVYNYVRSRTEAMSDYMNQSTSVLDHWTSSNNASELPRISYGDPTGNTVFSDRWIEDGSYVRLGQLSVNYQLPQIKGFIKGINVYATATNLFTITNYSGYDPDFIYLNSPFYMGVDYGKMPQTQSFILGLKLDL